MLWKQLSGNEWSLNHILSIPQLSENDLKISRRALKIKANYFSLFFFFSLQVNNIWLTLWIYITATEYF